MIVALRKAKFDKNYKEENAELMRMDEEYARANDFIVGLFKDYWAPGIHRTTVNDKFLYRSFPEYETKTARIFVSNIIDQSSLILA